LQVKFEARGPSFTSSDLSGVDIAEILSEASAMDVIVVCVGEGTYAEKPGDIDDLSMSQGQVRTTLEYSESFISCIRLRV
jgi:beta-glucosidase